MTHPDEAVLKTPGRYRVVIPKVGRQKYDRYIDVNAEGPEFAIQKVLDMIDQDPTYSRYWWEDSFLKVTKTWREPEWELQSDKDARSERARQRAIEARARRANRKE